MEATYWRTLMKPKRLLCGMTPQRGTADLNYSRGGKVKKTPNSMLTLLEIGTARLIRRRKNGTLQCSYSHFQGYVRTQLNYLGTGSKMVLCSQHN